MTILHQLRLLARKIGLEVNRYTPLTSQNARILRLLQYHKIDLVLDVGANDGGYGKELKQAGFEGSILSFEPLIEPYERLKTTARKYNNWYVAPRMALGDKDGEIEINVSRNSTSSSILPMEKLHSDAAPSSEYMSKQMTRIQRLDKLDHAIIKSGKRNFLKIDTQGYEENVLDGASDRLSEIHGVQIEMSIEPLYQGQVLYQDLIWRLNSAGFNLWNIKPGFSDPKSGRLLQMDGVFFRANV
jgi:FkbM family methyltransferase